MASTFFDTLAEFEAVAREVYHRAARAREDIDTMVGRTRRLIDESRELMARVDAIAAGGGPQLGRASGLRRLP